ncbi:PglZ domain-containing protein [candidate division KSB1 bacterium]|nr:PglZ domain-containing protein [candidate division KSB1 bacterium]
MTNAKGKILWVDDEIELLRPHIIFLEERGYDITPVTTAEDAISLIKEQPYDVILLDEMLLGMDGLTALNHIKEINPSLPVVMITKSEEEMIMEEAIGGKIQDYLIKPVNPSQILMTCKRILESKKIERERLSRDYPSEFNKVAQMLLSPLSWEDWAQLYAKLSEWEVELDEHPGLGLRQALLDQKRSCNSEFARFIETNYRHWLAGEENRPMLSPDLVDGYIRPLLDNGERVVFIVIDNLRLDQWLTMEPYVYNAFHVTRDHYYAILPTATPYARNAIFSGLYPSDLEASYPELWSEGSDDEHSLNKYEDILLAEQLKRLKIDLKSDFKYLKLLDLKHTRMAYKNITSYAEMPFVAIVVNFVDFLAHSRSDSEVLKEIAPDEAAYRSLTESWFEHSILLKILQKIAQLGNTIVITSDHGSIRSMRGAKVLGDRETSTNLRYKFGKNIKCNAKQAVSINDPSEYRLPARKINTNYLIAKEDYYFVYPTDYHHYLNYYRDSFQHGGISMEEMILPLIKLNSK